MSGGTCHAALARFVVNECREMSRDAQLLAEAKAAVSALGAFPVVNIIIVRRNCWPHERAAKY